MAKKRAPELSLFVGKGGVGKTTVSAAYAVKEAIRNPADQVLLISTDPAHSLADVLGIKLSRVPKRVPLRGRGTLIAWELDAAGQFQRFLGEHKQDILDVVERGSLFTAEEISPLLDTALPGMSEMAAMIAIQEAMQSGKYSRVVVDTAPFGHTLRLFGLPGEFAKLLDFPELAAGRDLVLAQHFGGRAQQKEARFIAEWRAMVEELQQAFATAQLFLVTTAESFALNESERCLRELRKLHPGLEVAGIVLNRVIVRPGKCTACKGKAAAARVGRSRLYAEYPSAKVYVAEDPGFPIVGANDLRQFADKVFSEKKSKWKAHLSFPHRPPEFKLRPMPWPVLTTPLTFVVGKGGVGKTTVSAALGFRSRAVSDGAVEICSIDPAPSLDDVFEEPIGDRPVPVLGDRNFRASEMDSVALFQSWVGAIKNEIESATVGNYSGVHVDLSFERQLFSALLEIVPPGIDEVLAVFRILDLVGNVPPQLSRQVIIDMAPTGHALELLRMPQRILIWSRLLLKSLAAHRKLALAQEAAVKIVELELRSRQLAKAFKSSKEVAIFAVMLAEPLPDRETERLLKELQMLDLPAKAILVNRMIFPEDAGKCLRCRSAMGWQSSVLAGLKRRYPEKEIYAIRDFGREIIGKKGLSAITKQLWLVN